MFPVVWSRPRVIEAISERGTPDMQNAEYASNGRLPRHSARWMVSARLWRSCAHLILFHFLLLRRFGEPRATASGCGLLFLKKITRGRTKRPDQEDTSIEQRSTRKISLQKIVVYSTEESDAACVRSLQVTSPCCEQAVVAPSRIRQAEEDLARDIPRAVPLSFPISFKGT